MSNQLNIADLLRRGGEMTPTELKQLGNQLTEAKLSELSGGIFARSLDQPVKVVPFSRTPPTTVGGYFTQQKFIWGKTPAEMEAVLGIFGKLQAGAYILEFESPIKAGDIENRAYSYLPDGKQYVPDPKEKVYLPGKGTPQWTLTGRLGAKCIAILKPGQSFSRSALL